MHSAGVLRHEIRSNCSSSQFFPSLFSFSSFILAMLLDVLRSLKLISLGRREIVKNASSRWQFEELEPLSLAFI